MKLIGGVMDGREIGNQTLPVLQTFEPLGEPELTFYRARKWNAEWPIPGWERFEIPPDLFKGEKYPTLYWRVKNYFTEDAAKKVEDFIRTDIYIYGVLTAYANQDDTAIDKYLESAIHAAHTLGVLTGYDERPEQ